MPLHKILFTPAFQTSLGKIQSYLSEQAGVGTATRFTDDLFSQIETLGSLPNLYPIYPDRPRFHKMVVSGWRYVAFYQIDDERRTVIVAELFHMRRNIPRLIRESKV